MAAPEGLILPLDMLLEIFSYLEVQVIEKSVAPVCRLWRDASRRPDLRRRLTLTNKIDPSAAEAMLRRSPQLAVLNFVRYDYTNQVLRAASTHNPELHVLDHHGPVSDIDFEAMALCTQLRTLSLRVTNKDIIDDGVVHLAGLCHLENLRLDGLYSVTPDGWRRLFSMCEWPQLRKLYLILRYADTDVSQLKLDRLHTTLRSINVPGDVSDVDLEAVAQCDQLRSLTLYNAQKVTDEGIVHLVGLRHLEKLQVICRNRVKPAGWRRLFSMCEWPHLLELSLDLSYAARDAPKGTFERLPASLRSIELLGSVTDIDLEVVAQCDQIRTLSLPNMWAVTDAGVMHLARLSHLETLRLKQASRVTRAGWSRLFSTCECPHLRELSLWLYEGDEESKLNFECLANTLRCITLYGCVSDKTLEEVAQCDQLRSLSLLFIDGPIITDDGVMHLVRLRHLEKLDLHVPNRVTPAGWRRLFSTCDWPHLRELCLCLYHAEEDEMPQVHFESLPTSLRFIILFGPVSDVDLMAVAQCDQLRALWLQNSDKKICSDITEGVVHLARLRHLEEFYLFDGISVTVDGWRRLLSTCEWPNLRQLTLTFYGAGEEDRDDLSRLAKLLCTNAAYSLDFK